MISVLVFLAWVAVGVGGVILGTMLFAILCVWMSGVLMEALKWTRDRRAILRSQRVHLQHEQVRESALHEQLSTARAENAQLQYENQTLQRQLASAGLLPAPKPREDWPRTVHGTIEDRRR